MKACMICFERHAPDSPECLAARVGQIVAGKYHLVEVIGAGGMGVVYKAEKISVGRTVALKMLRRRFSTNHEAVARLFREAHGAAQIGHPGIVDVRDVGTADDGAPYLEMELLEGMSVESLIGAGPVAPDRAVSIALGALEGLAAAHEKGAIHRDIKPANLFLSTEGAEERVKLLDFGFVKADDGIELTVPGQHIGSPVYMSPEQYRNPRTVDERTDIYSLGATLYHMLTNALPIEGKTVQVVFARIMTGQVSRHPREVRADLPEWLDAIVAKAMERDPANRFASAAEMAEALAKGLRTQLALPPPRVAPADSGEPSGRRLTDFRLRYVVAALLLVLVALGIFLLGSSRH